MRSTHLVTNGLTRGSPLAVAMLALLLTACGGGGGAATGGTVASTPPPANPPPPLGTPRPAVALLSARATAISTDRRTLSLEYELAVLRPDGSTESTLTASDFWMSPINCGDWYNCIENADGINVGSTIAASAADEVALLSARPRQSYAAGMLIDLSQGFGNFDPSNATLSAIKQYLGTVVHGDSVAIASFWGVPGLPLLTTYGPFTANPATLLPQVEQLAGQRRGTSPVITATRSMIEFTIAQTTSLPTSTRRAVVVWSVFTPDTECQGATTACKARLRELSDVVRAADIRLVSIGAPWIGSAAASNGGINIELGSLEQLQAIARGLDALLSGSIPRYRIRMTLRADSGTFPRDGNAIVFLNVRIPGAFPQEITGSVPIDL